MNVDTHMLVVVTGRVRVGWGRVQSWFLSACAVVIVVPARVVTSPERQRQRERERERETDGQLS